MRGLDYRSVVGQEPDSDPEAKAYVLRLGSVEFDPISYSTLLTLRDYPVVVREVLVLCFIERPVMWADRVDVRPGSYRAQLSEIEALLAAIDRRFEVAGRPCHGVLARIVDLWRGLTLAAVERLEEAADRRTGISTRSVVADYRRSTFPCVKTLLELLPDEDECSIEARRKLEAGTAQLVHGGPENLEDAGWRKTEIASDSEDPGFVTWGIP